MTAGISTGIHIHNLDQLGIGTLLVALVVMVAAVTIGRTVHQFRHLPPPGGDQRPEPPEGRADGRPSPEEREQR